MNKISKDDLNVDALRDLIGGENTLNIDSIINALLKPKTYEPPSDWKYCASIHVTAPTQSAIRGLTNRMCFTLLCHQFAIEYDGGIGKGFSSVHMGSGSEYKVTEELLYLSIGQVTMTEETAKKLCNALNSGSIKP